jgi:hypothetical protein
MTFKPPAKMKAQIKTKLPMRKFRQKLEEERAVARLNPTGAARALR